MIFYVIKEIRRTSFGVTSSQIIRTIVLIKKCIFRVSAMVRVKVGGRVRVKIWVRLNGAIS